MRFTRTAALLALFAVTAFADEPPKGDRFAEALTMIQKEYIRDLSRDELIVTALKGLAKELDPYSTYFTQDEYDYLKETLKGEHGGVGINIDTDPATKRPRIAHLMLEGAAREAGIRAGAVIEAVDGTSTEGMTLDVVSSKIRGLVGTPVELAVRNPGAEAAQSYKLTRRIVKMPSVRGARRRADHTWDYFHDPERKIGYIRVSKMAEDTTAEVEKALATLRAGGMKALVFDLRDNQGGLMKAAVDTADLFIDSGRLLTVSGGEKDEHYDAKPGTYTDFPMAVLVNVGTASSAEFLAAALQDHKRATFLGQRTFGKAYIQQLFPLSDGLGALRLTTAAFVRPSGKHVDNHYAKQKGEEGGVAPDAGMELKVEGEEYDKWWKSTWMRDAPFLLSEAESAHAPDRVLDRAVEVLAAELPKS